MVWSRGGGDPAVFETVAGFARATGQEQHHLDLVGRRGVAGTMRATPAVRGAADRIAEPLPAHLARALGRTPGVRHLGAWVG